MLKKYLIKIFAHIRLLFKGYPNLKRVYKHYKPNKDLASIVNEKTFVIYAVINWEIELAVNFVLGEILKKSNAKKIYVVLDNGKFKHWEGILRNDVKHKSWKEINYFNHFLWRFFFKLSWIFLKYVYGKDITILFTSKIMKKSKLDDNFDLNPYKKNIISSCRKFFQTTELDFENNIEHKRYYNLSKENVKIALRIAKYIDSSIKPDVFISEDGVYTLWATAYEYLKDKGYKCIIWENGGYREKYSILLNTASAMLIRSNNIRWKLFNAKEFESEKRRLLENYFYNRIYKIQFENKIYFKKNEELDKEFDNKPVFTIFPNVIWDGNIVERDVIFENILGWLVETVQFFLDNPEVGNLIIRFHPSESTLLDGCLKFEDALNKEYGNKLDNAENVTLIHSNKYVNSYNLIKEKTDVTIVYDSFVSLETIYLKKPVIIAGRGRYRDKGFSFDPKNRKEYFDMIRNPKKIIDEFNKNYDKYLDNMYKCTYFYLYHTVVLWPTGRLVFGIPKSNIYNVKTEDLEQLSRDLVDNFKELLE